MVEVCVYFFGISYARRIKEDLLSNNIVTGLFWAMIFYHLEYYGAS